MHINALFQNYFIKKRIIFKIEKIQLSTHPDYTVCILTKDLLVKHEDFLSSYINPEKLYKRMENPECLGILALERKTGTPVGFEWAIYSEENEYIHDKFIIPPKFGFLFNAYVVKEHRNKGIFRLIKSNLLNYLFKNTNCKEVLSVVESLNQSSLKANYKLDAAKYGVNYLIKVLGRNVFSIIKLKGYKLKLVIVPLGTNNNKL